MAFHVRRHTAHGWLLVGLIVLVAAVLLALAGVTFYLTEHLRSTSLRQNQTKAIYHAQAGVMYALYALRGGSGIAWRRYDIDNPGGAAPGPTIDAFVLSGKTADLLLVNLIPSTLDTGTLGGVGVRDRLRNWRLQNVQASGSAQVTHMTVSWTNPAAGQGVIRIEISGNRVWPTSGTASAPQPSGTELNISDVSIPADTARTGNTVWFATNGVMAGKASIDIAFRLADHVASGNPLDASIRTARYTPAVTTRSADITIKSEGEVNEGMFPFALWRRLQAEYHVCGTATLTSQCDTTNKELQQTGKLINWQELAQQTP